MPSAIRPTAFSTWLEQRLARLTVGWKITLGYAAALGIAVIGTASGFWVGALYQHRAYEQHEHAQHTIDLLHRLKIGLLQTRIRHMQPSVVSMDRQALQRQYRELLNDTEYLAATWTTLKTFEAREAAMDSHAEAFARFVNGYDRTVETYLKRLVPLIQQAERNLARSSTAAIAPEALLASVDRTLDAELDRLSVELTDLLAIAVDDYKQAEIDQAAVERLQIQVMVGSVVVSVAIAAWLAYGISRAIARPLRSLTLVAEHATQTANFDVQAPVTTQDEVGTLTIAVNHLMRSVQRSLLEQKASELLVHQRAQQLRDQNKVLSQLTRHEAIKQGELLAAVQAVTQATAQTLAVSRASVWLYQADGTQLECVDLFEYPVGTHAGGTLLPVVAYPGYFQALETEDLIVAPDARTHIHTHEFTEGYLTPLGICSMLDAPIRVAGQTVGVLCVEQVAVQRWWQPEDENFVRAVADLVALVVEVRDRQQAEAILRKSEETNRALIAAIPDLLIRMQRNGTYLVLAEGSEVNILSPELYSDSVTIYDVMGKRRAQERLDYVEQALQTGVLQSYEYQIGSGSERRYEEARIIACGVDEVLVMVRDVTDRRHIEESLRQSEMQLKQQAEDLKTALDQLKQTQLQMIQSEKMSSLGQLVAGVAHEINNPVNFIHGNLTYATGYTQDLLRLIGLYEQYYPNPVAQIKDEIEVIDLEFLKIDLCKLLNSMKMGTDRIRQIVLSLRNFSRMDEAEMKAVDIHEGIDSTLMILENRIKATSKRGAIAIVKDYGKLPLVECYAGQLNQVFMNLLSNAIDALEDRLEHESANESATTAERLELTITIRTILQDQQQAQIIIADNGLGIPDPIKQRIFDPFFTTKPVGKGTGMGLSISYQIVHERHGGVLTCSTRRNQGTEFCIQIPCRQVVNR